GANFFIEKDGILYTAPAGHILPGITRDTILQLCRKVGIEVKQKRFLPENVLDADGAFVVGTAAEVSGVNSFNDQTFAKAWNDTFGYRLQKEYEHVTRREEQWEGMEY
ncbi:MAG TPA: aminotransferase class IV, partial [Saprospiraceae bacterium]|nr:aminotransferase class IV [Saprospiraceae bacterium]